MMWSFQLRPFALSPSPPGGLCFAFFQLASSEATCESAERLCMSLFLATILLCVALCCLQRWLTRCRCFSSRRTVAVFALSGVDSVYENDVDPGRLPKVPPHPRSPERPSPCSGSNTAGDGPPPSYEEVVKSVSSPCREQRLQRGPAEASPCDRLEQEKWPSGPKRATEEPGS
ncbi:transmembrane protein 207 isoform X2 [Paroedura picta]|uniref:transmembrane protein 207 isoform X2 n=1 Tax=Paroedura picta TaxID=143630 RepID=UPI004055DFA5